MSVKLSDRVWEAPFPSLAMKLVALKLADYANDDGENVYPSVGTLERKTGASASTVREALADMEASGLLDVVTEASGNRHGRSTTVRRVDVATLAAIAAGELVWRRVDVPVHDLYGNPKLDASGAPRTRPAWRLVAAGSPDPGGSPSEPSPDENDRQPDPLRSPEGHRSPDPAPPVAGGVPLRSPDPNRQREPSSEPSLSPPAPRKRRGERERDALDEMISRVRSGSPARALAVDVLLQPMLRKRKFDAPDPEAAIATLADEIAAAGHGEAVLRKALSVLLAERGSVVKDSDVSGVFKRQNVLLAAKIFIDWKQDPQACAAWRRYAMTFPVGTPNRAVASLLDHHGGAMVDTRFPPSRPAQTGKDAA